ncbi:MAG: hypothetical protein KatS3mg111_0121 [Pirellulaceae bacterium]|nr:MAG: hypothetical protein KatS3mg111_0121 [Pirellulaceae bacterium]
MTKSTRVVARNAEGEKLDREVLEFRAQFDDRSPLDEIVRHGACRILQAAIEAEVEEFLATYANRQDDQGRRLVVRNGYKTRRKILTAAGPLEMRETSMLHFDGRTYRADPIGQVRLVKSDPYGELSSTGNLDWRMIGVQQFPFPWYAPTHGFSFDAHMAKSLRSGTLAKVEDVPREPDLLRIFRRSISDHPEVLGHDWDWHIDKTTLMSVEFTQSIRWKRDGVIKTAVERRET